MKSFRQKLLDRSCSKFREFMKNGNMRYEQLLCILYLPIFCGAVYDENAFCKVKFAYTDMDDTGIGYGAWLEKGRTFTLDDQI